MELKRPYRSVVDWTWRTMPVRFVFFHIAISLCYLGLLAVPADYWWWGLVGWVVVSIPLPLFWWRQSKAFKFMLKQLDR